jgi:hypothetical protein
VAAAVLVPTAREHKDVKMPHAELGIVAGGTLFGAGPE